MEIIFLLMKGKKKQHKLQEGDSKDKKKKNIQTIRVRHLTH